MRKSVTLIELLLAVGLLSTMVLGAVAFNTLSRRMLTSSERQVEVINELNFALDHIHKNVLLAFGNPTVPGIVLAECDSGGTNCVTIANGSDCDNTSTKDYCRLTLTIDADRDPTDPSGDTTLFYEFWDSEVKFNDGASTRDLFTPTGGVMRQAQAIPVTRPEIAITNGGVRVRNFMVSRTGNGACCTSPNSPACEPNRDPCAQVEEVFFFPLLHSWTH